MRYVALAISFCAVTLLGLHAPAVQAAETAPDTEGTRPTIGLVLAGGGAKGIAHVGVIKVLEEAGVPVDLVAGTSMGAIVGGLYSMGLNAKDLEALVLSIDWDGIFVDDTPRPELSIRRKTDDLGFLAVPRLRLKQGVPRLPLGVFKGQRLMLELRRLMLPAAAISDFDRLPIRFRAVAADVETGDTVILGSGDLALALRASMSVPGVFPPVEIDGRVLVDGGVVNNIPVDVVRQMGADIVIVSGFVETLGPAEELTSVIAVLNRTIDLMVLAGRREQLRSLTDADVLIQSDMGEIGAGSFDKAGDAIAPGETAARVHFARLVELGQLGAHQVQPLPHDGGVRSITEIVIEHDSPLSSKVIRARMLTEPGDPFDPSRLDEDMTRIYGLGIWETVTYTTDPTDSGVIVTVNAKQHSAGIDFLRFGIELQSDFDRESDYNVGVRYTAPALNSLNGELRSQVVVGTRLEFITEFYQPVDAAARYFVGTGLAVVDRDAQLFKDNRHIAEARVLEGLVDARAGINLSESLVAFGRISRGIGRVREVTGTDLVPEGGFDVASLGGGLLYDDLNELEWPTAGSTWRVLYAWSPETLGADEEFHSVEAAATTAFTFGQKDTFVLTQTANLTFDGNRGVSEQFELGGPFRLSGLLRGALSGDNSLLTRVVYYHELARFGPASLDTQFYVGGSLEYGGAFEDLEDIDVGDMLVGSSMFIGADTYLGPIYLGYGFTEGGEHAVFLALGSIF